MKFTDCNEEQGCNEISSFMQRWSSAIPHKTAHIRLNKTEHIQSPQWSMRISNTYSKRGTIMHKVKLIINALQEPAMTMITFKTAVPHSL